MSTFYWVRTYDQYNGWGTFYEGWERPLAEDFHGRVQAGALVIADMLDDTPGAQWRRETWQSYQPYTVPGQPRDVGGGMPPLPPIPNASPPPPPISPPSSKSGNGGGIAVAAVLLLAVGGATWYASR